jgi:DNA-binding PadR family transcriptional regulator
VSVRFFTYRASLKNEQQFGRLDIQFHENICSFNDASVNDMPRRKLDPLPTVAFHILLALASDDLHGYAIMRQVEEQTGGGMRLGPGTLYGSLKTLLEAGLIEELDERTDEEDGLERRRYYRLTSAGRKCAQSEAEKLANLLRVARAKRILGRSNV